MPPSRITARRVVKCREKSDASFPGDRQHAIWILQHSLSSAHRQVALIRRFQFGRNMMILVIAASRSFLKNGCMKTSTLRNGTERVSLRRNKVGFIAAIAFLILTELSANAAEASPLKPPAHGSIPVAFVISEGAVVIDFCGPWEVFRDVMVPGRAGSSFPSLHCLRQNESDSGRWRNENCSGLHFRERAGAESHRHPRAK